MLGHWYSSRELAGWVSILSASLVCADVAAGTLHLYWSTTGPGQGAPPEWAAQTNPQVNASNGPVVLYLWAHAEPGHVWYNLNFNVACEANCAVTDVVVFNPLIQIYTTTYAHRWDIPSTGLPAMPQVAFTLRGAGGNFAPGTSTCTGICNPVPQLDNFANAATQSALIAAVMFTGEGNIWLEVGQSLIQRVGGVANQEMVKFGMGDAAIVCNNANTSPGMRSANPDAGLLMPVQFNGACCLPLGTCSVTDPVWCVVHLGVFQGVGTSCNGILCTPTHGACCILNRSYCLEVGPSFCGFLHGEFHGLGVACSQFVCQNPTGACCFGNGRCIQMELGACNAAGGSYQGNNSTCNAGTCSHAGACCMANGSCAPATMVGGADCTNAGGVYQGDNTTCTAGLCSHPGACCMSNGACAPASTIGGADCSNAGGVYQGDNTTCTAGSCSHPGACCLAIGNCIQSTSLGGADCTAAGGMYQGDNTLCTAGLCSHPGACCLPIGTCVQAAALGGADCSAAGGQYQGDNTLCAVVHCIQPDRADAAQKGSLLIISDIELRWSNLPLAGNTLVQDTFIQLTNDNNQDVDVQMFFINGDPPVAAIPAGQPGGPERPHPGWNRTDNLIRLTPNQPTYWSALTGLPGTGGLSPFSVLDPGNPPGRPDPDPGSTDRVLRGFIIAFAVNSSGQEIKWNHLAGNATVVNYRDGTAWEYNAWGFQAVNPNLPTGAQTGTPGVLNLDGFEFSRGYDLLLMDFPAVGSTTFSLPFQQVISNASLTLHVITADLRQNTTGPRRTKAKFDVWNQNEVKFSGADRCITCWEQRLLGQWAPAANHFTRLNLQSNVGRARIDGEYSPVVCGANPPPPAVAVNGAFSLLGVMSTRLAFDAGLAQADAGTTLFGLGYETGTIWYDILPPPPTATGSKNPNSTSDEHSEARPEIDGKH